MYVIIFGSRVKCIFVLHMNASGDTMGLVPEEFYDVSVALNHSVAIEPEGGGNVVMGSANWDSMVSFHLFNRIYFLAQPNP